MGKGASMVIRNLPSSAESNIAKVVLPFQEQPVPKLGLGDPFLI
jgi:hypothetical protein